MKEQNNNKSNKKSGRFDIPVSPEQKNSIDNTNNTNTNNTNPPRNRFGMDSPNQSNTNTPPKRSDRFKENNNFSGVATPQESKFNIKQPTTNSGNETQINKFSTNDNPQSMQTMQIKQTTNTQQQTDTTKPTTNILKKYLLPIDSQFEWLRFGLLLFLILPITAYSYYPALTQIVYNWINKVDYSHGFFVIPLVGFFIYLRLDSYPGTRYRLCWLAMIPIALCVLMRVIASRYYMDALEETSLFFWLLGVVWFFYGTRAFLWALPSLCFLIFMFQLPYSIDMLMKHHLQLYAARFAAVLLQILGEPAIAINNVIRVKGEILNVEAACSGIRFLISVFAIASAAVLLMRKPWWQNLIVMLIAAPLAMLINASRITMTGILLLHNREFLALFVTKQRISAFADELAGYTMIIVVAVIFFLFLFYLDKVFKRVNM
ncbi:MAG: exosortase/archaeosortase family protein [Planctomycetaceae bacterium]|jgi:exosortase|nr:exosortase/archaeosortase family protein [Planctomycetaceae bacterium]